MAFAKITGKNIFLFACMDQSRAKSNGSNQKKMATGRAQQNFKNSSGGRLLIGLRDFLHKKK
jgi:hypothetical protein